MSVRLFQSIVNQMKEVVERTIGVVNENYVIVACSDPHRNDTVLDGSIMPGSVTDPLFTKGQYTYKALGEDMIPEYTVFVEGTDEQAAKYANLLAISLDNIKLYYDEKHDRRNFVKNIILDNILPGDITLKARELHFENEVSRTVLLLRITNPNDVSVYDVVQNLFPDKNRDFVINISESDIAIVKEIKGEIENKDLEKLARSIVDTLSSEFYTHAVIGIGTTVDKLKDVGRSFKEAQVALEVGKIFDTEKPIVSYDSLGIARLIYQLPTTLCESFLREVFKNGTIASLDQETLFTIQRFFENNLNVSETSRKLFVHRNTLVYRLEKIKKITGLDLREFDHAIVFKIALMVQKYMRSNPTNF